MKVIQIVIVFQVLVLFSHVNATTLPGGWVVSWGYGEITTGATHTFGLTRSLLATDGQVLSNAVAISTDGAHILALKSDGTVVPCGGNLWGEEVVPEGLSNVIAILAGGGNNLALKSDGKVVAWGRKNDGTHLPQDLTNVVALGGTDFVLKGDGRPFAWGQNNYSRDHQMFIPAGLSNVVALCKNYGDGVALRSDGTVAEWSFNGQIGVDRRPLEETNGEAISWVERLVDFHVIEGLSNVTSVAAGRGHGLALKRNGTVFGWGFNNAGQATGIQTTNSPLDWGPYANDSGSSQGLVTIDGNIVTNVVAIAAGDSMSMALKSDGTVVTWGFIPFNAQKVPDGLSNVVAIADGCLAITTNSAVADRFRQK